MKVLALLFAALALACDAGPDLMPETPSYADGGGVVLGNPKSMTGDVQAIKNAWIASDDCHPYNPCPKVKTKIRFNYNIDWDTILSVGMGGTNYSKKVTGADKMICPNLWALSCNDQYCNGVNWAAYNIGYSARGQERLHHFPGTFNTAFCEYTLGGTVGLPTHWGDTWVWWGYQCPSGQFVQGGSTGIGSTTYYTLPEPYAYQTFNGPTVTAGPYSQKGAWSTRMAGCVSPPAIGPEFSTPITLSADWCSAYFPYTQCAAGSNTYISVGW